jgi:hypothetical protein
MRHFRRDGRKRAEASRWSSSRVCPTHAISRPVASAAVLTRNSTPQTAAADSMVRCSSPSLAMRRDMAARFQEPPCVRSAPRAMASSVPCAGRAQRFAHDRKIKTWQAVGAPAMHARRLRRRESTGARAQTPPSENGSARFHRTGRAARAATVQRMISAASAVEGASHQTRAAAPSAM